MSSFECQVVALEISPHPDADRLDLARVGGYVCVTQKGRFQTGDLAIYVPEDAVVPESVLRAGGFWDEEKDRGILAGKNYDRVKAIRLRGVLSQGILLGLEILGDYAESAHEGEDVSSELGITKWEPPIPVELAGDVKTCPGPLAGYTDIENLKKYPDVLVEGEDVVATEKAHGSCMIVLYHEGEIYVSSKGMASKRLYLVDTKDDKGNSKNAYWRALYAANLDEKLHRLATASGVDTITLYGELLGVQDLKYGMSNGEVRFVAFDIRMGTDEFMDYDGFITTCYSLRIPMAKELYHGPYSPEAIAEVTDGKESYTGEELHVREGVVVRPVAERRDAKLGRVILKSVSGDYLTRRGGTEYQ